MYIYAVCTLYTVQPPRSSHCAPGKEDEGVQFSNLMNLLGELVRQVFSYEKYLKKLISRGDLPMRLSKFNMTSGQDFTLLCKELHTLPRHIQYVFSLPLPDTHKG